VVNGQHDRFEQSVQNVIRFVYNSFGTPDVLSQICIVFTRCYAMMPNQPNRELKRREYAGKVREFLQEVSNGQNVPRIPVFFVDSKDENGEETRQNLQEFDDWLTNNSSLDTRSFRAVDFHNEVEDEEEEHVFVGYEIEGDCRYANYVDRKRYKVTPYTHGEPTRYSPWEITKEYQELDGERTCRTESRIRIRDKRYVTHDSAHSMFGFSSSDHTHWSIWRQTWTEECDHITDFDGKETITPWRQAGEMSERTLGGGREHGWTSGWVKEIQ
jgi:hypothetical protein